MNKAKIEAAAKIVKDSAIEFLANKHGLTIDEVTIAILTGNQRACEQFATLVAKGMEETLRLHDEGKISLA